MHLQIAGKPIPKARPRVVFGPGRTYAYSPTAEAEQAVRTLARAEGFRPLEGPVRMTVSFYPDRTEVEVEPVQKGRAKRPDIANYLAFLADALQGAAYLDDAQITEIHAYKLKGESRMKGG